VRHILGRRQAERVDPPPREVIGMRQLERGRWDNACSSPPSRQWRPPLAGERAQWHVQLQPTVTPFRTRIDHDLGRRRFGIGIASKTASTFRFPSATSTSVAGYAHGQFECIALSCLTHIDAIRGKIVIALDHDGIVRARDLLAGMLRRACKVSRRRSPARSFIPLGLEPDQRRFAGISTGRLIIRKAVPASARRPFHIEIRAIRLRKLAGTSSPRD
jgi:hypothetical protein